MAFFQIHNQSNSCPQETLCMTDITNEHEYNEIIDTLEGFYDKKE